MTGENWDTGIRRKIMSLQLCPQCQYIPHWKRTRLFWMRSWRLKAPSSVWFYSETVWVPSLFSLHAQSSCRVGVVGYLRMGRNHPPYIDLVLTDSWLTHRECNTIGDLRSPWWRISGIPDLFRGVRWPTEIRLKAWQISNEICGTKTLQRSWELCSLSRLFLRGAQRIITVFTETPHLGMP